MCAAYTRLEVSLSWLCDSRIRSVFLGGRASCLRAGIMRLLRMCVILRTPTCVLACTLYSACLGEKSRVCFLCMPFQAPPCVTLQGTHIRLCAIELARESFVCITLCAHKLFLCAVGFGA